MPYTPHCHFSVEHQNTFKSALTTEETFPAKFCSVGLAFTSNTFLMLSLANQLDWKDLVSCRQEPTYNPPPTRVREKEPFALVQNVQFDVSAGQIMPMVVVIREDVGFCQNETQYPGQSQGQQ